MENKKKLLKSIVVIAVVLSVLAVAMVGAASAKSLYVNKDIKANSPISAYDIQPAPTYLAWQQTSAPTRYGGVGLGIDTDSATLFVSFETSGKFDIVDATNLKVLGQVTAPNAGNLAGMVMDQDKQLLYACDRGAKSIYIYTWNAVTKTLTYVKTQPLSGVSSCHGLALDEKNDVLYVGDATTAVKSFKTSDWSSAGNYIACIQSVQGVAFDTPKQILYTGHALGSGLLCKYELNTNTRANINIRSLPGAIYDDNVIGLAVDQNTSLLYITTGNQWGTGSDKIRVFDSNLNLLHSTGDIGNPTGICVPGKDISYNPLDFSKVDDVANCVNPGDTYTYTLNYKNTNPSGVTGVTIVDTLPSEVSFESCSDSCDQTGLPTTVSWTIGNLNPGQSGSVTLTVKVKPGIAAGTKINNSAVINGNEANTGPTTKTEQTDVCPEGNGNCCACLAGSQPGDPCKCTQAADRDDCENTLNGTWVDLNGCTLGTTTGCEGLYCQNGECIPEFSTIALPVASILGLLFYFNYRKRKREQ
ncbi:6-phosphogluconolactonase, cycloisomerase 2 family [Candidatus Methanophagaceae archaeon]|nr:6-phosphogluconolactonase, cycloisomerase 2 family [Methanophagales archaeon]